MFQRLRAIIGSWADPLLDEFYRDKLDALVCRKAVIEECLASSRLESDLRPGLEYSLKRIRRRILRVELLNDPGIVELSP